MASSSKCGQPHPSPRMNRHSLHRTRCILKQGRRHQKLRGTMAAGAQAAAATSRKATLAGSHNGSTQLASNPAYSQTGQTSSETAWSNGSGGTGTHKGTLPGTLVIVGRARLGRARTQSARLGRAQTQSARLGRAQTRSGARGISALRRRIMHWRQARQSDQVRVWFCHLCVTLSFRMFATRHSCDCCSG